VFTLKRNGTSIGTITFAASGTTGTFSFASSVTWAAGDLFEMDGPATADTTLANINIDLAGNM
jgi:Iap family predicted aminopeptidase